MAFLLVAGITLVLFGTYFLQLAYQGNSDAGLAGAAFYVFAFAAFATAFLAGGNDTGTDGRAASHGIDPIWPWPSGGGNGNDDDDGRDGDIDLDID